MPSTFALIQDVHARAQRVGVIPFVLQFDNLATHAQYLKPYEIAQKSVAPGARVLDWGCGNGHFSFLLDELGAEVTGYSFDPPPPSMQTSTHFTFVAGSEDDPRTIPFPDATFDVVCSVGVLEHVWETGGTEIGSLAEVARVLKPAGVFLCFHLPNECGWVEPFFRLLGLQQYHHKRRYNRTSIRALWQEGGLGVADVGTYNFLPRNILSRLPKSLRRSTWFARLYNAIDSAANALLGRFSTNFYVIGKRLDVASSAPHIVDAAHTPA
jgi:SAM-dependent methyltransferase